MRWWIVLGVWFAATALYAQCPAGTSSWGSRVTVQFEQSAPQQQFFALPSAPPPQPVIVQHPTAVVIPRAVFAPTAPVYAAPSPRIEVRTGPFGRVRRVIVN